MSRAPTAAFDTALAGRHLDQVVFAALEFASGTSRVCTRDLDLQWDGETWLGKGRVGQIEQVDEGSQLEARQIAMTLSAIPAGVLATALDPAEYKNRLCKLWFGLMEPDVIDFNFTQATLSAAVGAALAAITFTRSGATATRVNESGVIETVAADTPRFDYDPLTLECKGLLIEEARTNLITNSGAETNLAGFGGNNCSNFRDATHALHGGFAVKSTTTNVGNSGPYSVMTSGVAASTAHSFTVWAYAEADAVGKQFTPRIEWKDGAGVTITTAAGSPATLSAGWNKIVFTATSPVGTARATVTLYTTSAQGVFNVWTDCWQFEPGAFATSHIPTDGATATRNPDVATVSDISGFYNASEGSAFAEYLFDSKVPADSLSGRILDIDDGTASERISFLANASNSQVFVVDGGVNVATLNGAVPVLGTPQRMAAAYKLNDYAASTDGNAIQTDAAASVPTVTQIALGRFPSSSTYLNGHLRRFTYYPKRLSNAALVRLSGGGDVLAEAVGQRVVADPVGPFTYRMDSLEFEVGETNSVRLSAYSRLEDWQRPRVRRYNDSDQRAAFPDDRFFEYTEQLVTATLIW